MNNNGLNLSNAEIDFLLRQVQSNRDNSATLAETPGQRWADAHRQEVKMMDAMIPKIEALRNDGVKPPYENKVRENIIEITWTFDRLEQEGKLSNSFTEDFPSSVIKENICTWAEEFEEHRFDSIDHDYLTVINKFAEEKILEAYGDKDDLPSRIENANIQELLSEDTAKKIIETREPRGLYYLKAETGTYPYVAIDNTTGDAWTEEFASLSDCIDYLCGKSVEEIKRSEKDEGISLASESRGAREASNELFGNSGHTPQDQER